MNNPLDITTFSVEKLKSLAYDARAIIDFHQKNLQVINEEISKRVKEEKEVIKRIDLTPKKK